jgi:hypothetical protein
LSTQKFLAACILTLFAASTFSVAATTGTPKAVALIGQQAPSTSGGTFSSLGKPSINTHGDVAYRADISGGAANNGIFLASNGTLTAIAVSGSSGAWYFNDFGDPSVNDAGQVAFMTRLGRGVRNNAIFLCSSSGLAMITSTGDPAPGTAGTFLLLGQFGLALNNSGRIVFQASFAGGQSGEGIFAYANGQVTPIVLTSQPANGSVGGLFSHFSGLAVNNLGQVGFTATLLGVNSTSGLFVADSKGIHSIAVEGQTAPYSTGGAIGRLRQPSISDTGNTFSVDNVAQKGGRFKNYSSIGLLQGTQAGISAVAHAGPPAAASASVATGNFFHPHIVGLPDGSDALLFAAWSTVGTNALFVNSHDMLQRVVMEGDTASAGGTYSFISFSALSPSGQFAFISNLKNSSARAGLFVGQINF